MNHDDIDFIEKHLSLELPRAFVNYMKPFPRDLEHRFANGVQTNAELFVINQLRHFFETWRYDYYHDQPDLRRHKFIYIGDDGCGNFYFMRGDAPNSNELWFWEHDPPNGFGIHERLKLEEYLGNEEFIWGEGWKVISCMNPFTKMSSDGKVISRANHPFRSVLNPITLDEWAEVVKQSPIFELDEHVTRTNPFTKEPISERAHPGRAKITDAGIEGHVKYDFGSLVLHCAEHS